MPASWGRGGAGRWVPAGIRRWVRVQRRKYGLLRRPVGTVQLGHLGQVSPISAKFGFDRGMPIDRYYTEKFLSAHRTDVYGRVLEIGDHRYTHKFGGDRVTRSDVLHVVEGNPDATIVADLTRADHIPAELFDCIICTQTLQMIYDVRAALRHLYRVLKPGGVLLATSHGISRVARREGVDPWGEYWHFTSQGLRRLLQETAGTAAIHTVCYGNVLAAIPSLHGLAAEDLSEQDLEYADPNYEVLIGVRVVKPEAPHRPSG
jgi:SAM-dependent methyltransferase